MTGRVAISAVLLLTACGKRDQPPAAPAADAVPADTSAWVLGASSLGKYPTGVTLAEFNSELGETLVPAYEISTTCDHVESGNGIVLDHHDDPIGE